MGFLKKYKWHKVADSAAELVLGAGDICEVAVEGTTICLGRYKAEWYGFASVCPHAGAAMSDAYIDGSCRVVCAVHQLKFDLKNGRDANGDGYKLKTYPVEVRADGVYVGVESGWF
jgi:nitrite reductase/ring-hydroxylating ferredoxin subunit